MEGLKVGARQIIHMNRHNMACTACCSIPNRDTPRHLDTLIITVPTKVHASEREANSDHGHKAWYVTRYLSPRPRRRPRKAMVDEADPRERRTFLKSDHQDRCRDHRTLHPAAALR